MALRAAGAVQSSIAVGITARLEDPSAVNRPPVPVNRAPNSAVGFFWRIWPGLF
jgi:hypothetical protein